MFIDTYTPTHICTHAHITQSTLIKYHTSTHVYRKLNNRGNSMTVNYFNHIVSHTRMYIHTHAHNTCSVEHAILITQPIIMLKILLLLLY